MDIYSPSDCFVDKVRPSGLVQKGQELIVLKSPEVDKQIDRVKMYQEELSINARKYLDGRQAEWKKLQSQLLEQIKVQLDSQRSLHKIIQDKFDAGVVTQDELDNAKLQLASTEISFLQQQQAVVQFDREMKDAMDELQSKTKHAQGEMDRLSDLKKRLLISAPFDGDFTPRCAKDLFFGTNECLGVLNTWAS